MTVYGYSGTMKATPGHRDDVVAILLRASDGLRAAGCQLYVVSVSDEDPDTIWIYEAWESKAHHDASLQMPETQAAIGEAMPMLTGDFTGIETTIVGGLGVDTGLSR